MLRNITSIIIVTFLVGCAPTDRFLQIDLPPAYVSSDTVSWCISRKCPDFVRDDLTDCHANALKQEFRNDLDESVDTQSWLKPIRNMATSLWSLVF